jgi:hypothetical protein
MGTLFLDFDGVLHPVHCHESRHFCCLPVFEEVLRSATDWDVVITSTWRLQFPIESLRAHFSYPIASRIIGTTQLKVLAVFQSVDGRLAPRDMLPILISMFTCLSCFWGHGACDVAAGPWSTD